MVKWKKLRNGEWGVCGSAAEIRPGFRTVVQKRDGQTTTVVVDKIIWCKDGVAIATIKRSPRRRGRCNCPTGEELINLGYGHLAGQWVICPECGGWAEVA